MKIAVLSLGSRGDLEPNLAVAEELRTRGHHLVLTVNTAHLDRVSQAGFEAREIPVDLSGVLRQFMMSRNLVKFGREVSRLEARAGAAIDEALITGCAGADAVVTSPMTTLRAQCVVERNAQPLVLNLPYPLERSSAYHPSFLGDYSLPPLLRRPAHAVFEQVYRQANRATIRRIRRRLGLPGTGLNSFARLRAQRTPQELLVSPVLFPKPPDWPDYCTIAGMPASSGERNPDPELDVWLSHGEPPVFFGFGSMSLQDPAGLLELIGKVATRLGVRALVGAGWSDLPLGDRGRTFVTRSIDYRRALPQCAAAVHHGGSGTTHDVARAGIPAVVVSVGGDQPLWGRQVRDLGIGVTFPFRKLTGERLHDALATVLAPQPRQRAKTAGLAVRRENGTLRLSDTVERVGSVCGS
ncbi:glycosyltransferase [Streptomyces sp. NPDC059152]|uniref:glycosyltransferase n=1 Tax=Streptomyces sp. NPDC059152 TaxID=3346742 RepID=UPI00368E1F4F